MQEQYNPMCSICKINKSLFLPYVEQGFGFVHLYITDGTVFAGFQVAHNAHFANYNPGKKVTLIILKSSKCNGTEHELLLHVSL